jgi:hypothetical protein
MKLALIFMKLPGLDRKALGPHVFRGDGEKPPREPSESAASAQLPPDDFTILLDAIDTQLPRPPSVAKPERPSAPLAQVFQSQSFSIPALSAAMPAPPLGSIPEYSNPQTPLPATLPPLTLELECNPQTKFNAHVVVIKKEQLDLAVPPALMKVEPENQGTGISDEPEAQDVTDDPPVDAAETPKRREIAAELVVPVLLEMLLKPPVAARNLQPQDDSESRRERQQPEEMEAEIPPPNRAGVQRAIEVNEVRREARADAKADREPTRQFQSTEIQPPFTVVKSETTLAPVQPPAQQVFTEIIRMAPLPSSAAPAPVMKSQANVVKTIQVSLRPESLGHVIVEMRLRGEKLEVKVDVETVAAHAELSRDEGVLRDLLADAGYALSDTPILLRVMPPETSTAIRQDGNAAAQNQPSHREAQAREEQGRQQRGARDDRTTPMEFSDARDGEIRRAGMGDGVFL